MTATNANDIHCVACTFNDSETFDHEPGCPVSAAPNIPTPADTTGLPLKAVLEIKVQWEESIFTEMQPGGLIVETFPEWDYRHFAFVAGMRHHIDSRSGRIPIGMAKLARKLGYESNSHPGNATRRMLLELGWLVTVEKTSRVPGVRIAVPRRLTIDERYAELSEAVVG